MIKSIIAIMLILAMGILGATFLGDGVLTFNSKAKAETTIEEARNVERAMKIYAMENNGRVDLGDIDLGEDVLKYIKDDELIKKHVGSGDAGQWRLNPGTNILEKIIKSESECSYINNIKSGTPLEDPVPTCGTPDGDEAYCCFNL
jgi:hypothetical protein